jgi:hypothetical protein
MNGERTRLLLTVLAVALLGSILGALRVRRARATKPPPDDEAPNVFDPGELYVTLASLEEARMMEHTAVVMRGAGGKQIYATVPVKYVECDEAALASLVLTLDAVEGRSNGGTVKYELAPIDSGIEGGMGGATIVDGVWLHPRLADYGIFPYVADVVHGRQSVEAVRPQLLARAPGASSGNGAAGFP